ncbi:uncharacterized protein LOC118426697 [Branchiostoma floridae]|uniref:Uncharacterized protein LOC118426697 n=2 Tax=Branchiostoma floridae TaxID=7739 RepID=A0A9J7N6T7_BRAFL|nr:uncharacterized protein LOC118426697 [Branchiostoma floridae]
MVGTRKKVGGIFLVLPLLLFVCVGEEDVRRRHVVHERDDVNVRHAQNTRDVCDDGKTDIAVDLEGIKYECEDEQPFPVYGDMSPSRSNCSEPKEPMHKCMRDRITYTQRIPHSGMHRPKWARYGTYKYLPPQRWLHNIEHGAVVALYDPCAPGTQVAVLKQTVRRCLRKHIITPYTQLTHTYPFALSAWGCTLEMAHINVTEVQGWIMEHALQSGEESRETRDGQYSHWLLQPADIVSDQQESDICPDIETTSTTAVTQQQHTNSTQYTEVRDTDVQVHMGSGSSEPHTALSVGPTEGSSEILPGDRRLVTDSQFVKNMVMSKRGKPLTLSTTVRKQFSLHVPQMASSRVTTQVTDTSSASGSGNGQHSGTVQKTSSPVQTQQTSTLSRTQKLPADKVYVTQRTPHSHQVNQSVTTNALEGFHQDQAYWALGSLVFLLGLLAGAVYHTKLWRKKVQGEMFKQVETVKDWEQAPKEKLSIPGLIRKKFDLLRQKTTRYHLLNQQEVLYNAMFSDGDSDGDRQ